MATSNPQPSSPPGNPIILALLRGDTAEAERLARTLLAHAIDIDALNALGLIEHQRGQHVGARVHFSRALVVAPHAVPPALNLALVYLGQSQLQEARKW